MGVLFFRQKSCKFFRPISIPGPYISVGELKDLFFETKLLKGNDSALIITNSQTGEDFVDKSSLISAHSSVVIRRLPGCPKPIVLNSVPELNFKQENKASAKSDSVKREAVSILDSEEFDEFVATNSSAIDDNEEDCKSKDSSGGGSDGGGGIDRRILWRNTPPEGYVCRRCKFAGHVIRDCPTNGDSDYDLLKIRAPVVAPNEAAFEREFKWRHIIQMRSGSVAEIPLELYCKICKKVMENAVIASKCCNESFCDECIRNFMIANFSTCFCGASDDIFCDNLLPNLTLRKTINHMVCEYDENHDPKFAGNLKLQNSQTKVVSSPGQTVDSNKEAKKEVQSPPSMQQSLASKKRQAPMESNVSYENLEGSKKKRGKRVYCPAATPVAFTGYNPYRYGPHTGAMNFGVGPLGISFGMV